MKKQLLLVLLPLFLFLSCSDTTGSGGGSSIAKKHVQIDSLHYVAIGASDAVGEGADTVITGTDTLIQGYVFLIERQLKGFVTNLQFKNLGKSGYTIRGMNREMKDKAVALKPDLITIWAGGNDCMDIMDGYMTEDDFKNGLDTLLGTLTEMLPDADIVIANLPDMTKLPSFVEGYSGEEAKGKALIQNMNKMISTASVKYGVSLVDLYSAGLVSNPKNISSDDFHPSTAGYTLMMNKYMERIHTLYPYQ